MKIAAPSRSSSKRGSVLSVVLILTSALALMIAGTLSNAVLESKLNEEQIVSINVNNTAESVVDYGVAQLLKRWEFQTSFKDKELAPNAKPLKINDELKAFLSLPVGGDSPYLEISKLELTGGVIPPNVQFYIDPNDPANQFDRHKGKMVLARDVEIYGMAEAKTTSVKTKTAYAMVTFQLRDAPLFSHAIFYNMDLELHPGPAMTIAGPVHSNGNIWAVAVSSLQFNGVVTTAKDYRISMMRKEYQGNWSSMPGESGQSGKNVKIKDGDGNWLNSFRTGDHNKESSYWTVRTPTADYQAQGKANYKEWEANKYDGNLKSGSDVPTLNAVGYEDYVAEYDNKTGQTQELQNHAYAIIEPNLKFDDPKYKNIGENSKMAREAGLIMKVHRSPDGSYQYASTGNTKLKDPTTGNDLRLPDNAVQLRSRPDVEDGWSSATRIWTESSTAPAPSSYNTEYYASFYKLEREDSSNPNSDLVLDKKTITTKDKDGNDVDVEVTQVREIPIYISEDIKDFDQNGGAKTSDGALKRADFDEMVAAHPFKTDSDGNVQDGMIDQRIKDVSNNDSKLSLIEINSTALAEMVEVHQGDVFEDYDTPDNWNGVLYVEFPRDPSQPNRTDGIVRSDNNMGLLLTNGGGANGRVPNPDFNINKENRDEGFTLVTNNALYVKGHFNADGNMNTPSTTDFNNSDDKENPRPPVALMGDAITILSDSFKLTNTKNRNPGASETEFAAAIVSGLMPTNKNGNTVSSGGSHNFPRFLENWGNKRFRYRGSLVALFESEIQNQKWSTGYYSPPKREWGFYQEFAYGNYPPGTPNVRDYKKMDFRFLTKAEYDKKLNDLPWN